MTDYHVRLDPIGRNDSLGGSYSTVLIAEVPEMYRGHRSIPGVRSLHWGHASSRGESSPVVTLKFGFVSITVDEGVVGKPRLKALKDSFYNGRDTPHRADPDPETRREAAHAAMLAENYKLAGEIEPQVLFDAIAHAIMDFYGAHLNGGTVEKLLYEFQHHVNNVQRAAFEDGRRDAKHELRAWLGVGDSGRFDDQR